jgi:hypothetical protein
MNGGFEEKPIVIRKTDFIFRFSASNIAKISSKILGTKKKLFLLACVIADQRLQIYIWKT